MTDKYYKSIEVQFREDEDVAETIEYVVMLIKEGYTYGTDPIWELIPIDTLEKPDTTKPVFQLFPKQKKAVKASRCPLCGERINVGPGPTEFRNKLSMKEYRISGICMACQDKIYGKI